MKHTVFGRTHEIYEDIVGYKKPPLISCQPWTPKNMAADVDGFIRKFAIKFLLGLSGYSRAIKNYDLELEKLLKYQYLRNIVPHGPVGSASCILAAEPEERSYLDRAARLTIAGIKLHNDFYQGKLRQEVHKNTPQEMGQFGNLFGNSICVPDATKIYKSASSNKILVVCRGVFYIVDISSIISGKINYADLTCCFAAIVEDSKDRASDQIYKSPSEIAACHPAIQLPNWEKLLKIDVNRESLATLHETLFTLCLDITDDTSNANIKTYATKIHSGNFDNRWHHASMQIVVNSYSVAGAIFSFDRYIDGNIMARASAELYERAWAESKNRTISVATPEQIPFYPLQWHINKNLFVDAKNDLTDIVNHLEDTIYDISEYSQASLGNNKKLAVPIFVVGLALTFKEITGKTPVINQLLDMASHRYMGIGSANVTTEELQKFLEAWENKSNIFTAMQKQLLISACISQQSCCRKSRSELAPPTYLYLFLKSRKRLQQFFGFMGFGVYQRHAKNQDPMPDVFISHPSIDHRIEYLGRPGTRYPYINLMTMHYQIREHETRLVLASPASWKEPHNEFVQRLKEKLVQLTNIINQPDS